MTAPWRSSRAYKGLVLDHKRLTSWKGDRFLRESRKESVYSLPLVVEPCTTVVVEGDDPARDHSFICEFQGYERRCYRIQINMSKSEIADVRTLQRVKDVTRADLVPRAPRCKKFIDVVRGRLGEAPRKALFALLICKAVWGDSGEGIEQEEAMERCNAGAAQNHVRAASAPDPEFSEISGKMLALLSQGGKHPHSPSHVSPWIP